MLERLGTFLTALSHWQGSAYGAAPSAEEVAEAGNTCPICQVGMGGGVGGGVNMWVGGGIFTAMFVWVNMGCAVACLRETLPIAVSTHGSWLVVADVAQPSPIFFLFLCRTRCVRPCACTAATSSVQTVWGSGLSGSARAPCVASRLPPTGLWAMAARPLCLRYSSDSGAGCRDIRWRLYHEPCVLL